MDFARAARVAVSLLLLFSCGCSKQGSISERNAEIDRRIDERLAARHQAEEQQRLGQERAALEAREKSLAARETSFATMVAALPAQTPLPSDPTADSEDASSLTQGTYSAPETYSTYPEAANPVYSEPYGYVSNSQPYFSDPYFCPPTTTFVSVINQTAVIVNQRRNFRQPDPMPRRSGEQPARPAQLGGPRSPVAARPPAVAQHPPTLRPLVINRRPPLSSPGRTAGSRPVRSVGATPVVSRRAAAKPALALQQIR